MAVAHSLRAFVEHPLTKLVVGIVLLTSGISEAYEELTRDFSSLRLRSHHGVMVIGFINILASVPDLMEGLSSGVEVVEGLGESDDHDQG